MNLFNYLQKKNIMTREMAKIFVATLFFYVLSWVFLKHHLSWWTMSLLFIVLGGTANLYVIDFNNFHMPVLARNRRELQKMKKKNQNRRICMLNSKTKLGLLADRFCVGKSIYSLGDFLVFSGAALAALPFVAVIILRAI